MALLTKNLVPPYGAVLPALPVDNQFFQNVYVDNAADNSQAADYDCMLEAM